MARRKASDSGELIPNRKFFTLEQFSREYGIPLNKAKWIFNIPSFPAHMDEESGVLKVGDGDLLLWQGTTVKGHDVIRFGNTILLRQIKQYIEQGWLD